jgi:hypothetical protein
MLSSSFDPSDIQRAKLNPLVIDFIEKPLNKTILIKMFGCVIGKSGGLDQPNPVGIDQEKF